MKSVVFAAPILPGKMGQFLQFVQDINVTRRAEYEDQQRRLGITRSQFWLQKTAYGDFALIAQDGKDIGEARRTLRASVEPFDVWFRQQIQEIHGNDVVRDTRPPHPRLCIEFHQSTQPSGRSASPPG